MLLIAGQAFQTEVSACAKYYSSGESHLKHHFLPLPVASFSPSL